MRRLAVALAFVVGCHSGGREPPPNAPPSVAASATPTTTRIGAPVAFTAVVSDPDGAIEKVVWNFGDGTGATGSQPPAFGVQHAYADPGTFTVLATAVDDRGGMATDFAIVDVLAVDGPIITLDAIELLGTLDDPAVLEVIVTVDGGPDENVAVQGGSFTKEIPVSASAPTVVEVNAEDPYGNPASVSLTITVGSP